MSSSPLTTPVVLIIFKRPDTTARVMHAIKAAAPQKLFVIADGPRTGRDDAKLCDEARSLALDITWECDVQSNFSDSNLGTKERVASGLKWVFAQVEEAIILEDDCVPDPSFFHFCHTLLARYRTDNRIMHIAGSNFQQGYRRTDDSYYFSCFPHVWGWATWRRAWQLYDGELTDWPQFRDQGWLHDWLLDIRSEQFWRHDLNQIYSDPSAWRWDIRWMFSCWKRAGLSILPATNLVMNIGHGVDAMHTVNPPWNAKLCSNPMHFPLRHPPFPIRDRTADLFTQRTIFRTNPLHVIEGRLWRAWRELRYKQTSQ